MRLPHYYRLPQKNKRGVTLLETAIVLAIVGGIVGALFAAASFAVYRTNVNQATDELNEIAQNMRSLFAGRTTAYATLVTAYGFPINVTAGGTDFTNFTPGFIQQSVFPNEMLSPPVPPGTTPPATTIANTPWNTLAQVALAGTAGAPTPPAAAVQFVVRYNGISADACADLLTRNSLPGRGTGLTQILVSSGFAYTSAAGTLPVTSIASTAACPAGGTYTIDWYYNL